MATIEQILRMSAAERKSAYKAERIEKVTIDGIDFTDYGAFSFLWEKSYVKSPERSGDGSIGNLNSYSTFVTPHLKIDFSLMSIDSYRQLMNLIYTKNEFTVTCYDVVNNQTTTNRMYFTTEEMPKLWTIAKELNGENWVEVLGIQEYVVEMVGTNASLDTLNILYYDNNNNLIADASQTVVRGEEVVISYNFVAPSGYRFDGEWLNGSGSIVRNGDVIKANTWSDEEHDIKLTAKVYPTNQYIISFDYGNGNTLYNRQNGEAIYEIPISTNQSISQAISAADIYLPDGTKFAFPTYGTGSKSVEIDGKIYSPYTFEGWYWTTEPSENSRVTGASFYKSKWNRTIHQIYSPIKYSVTYETNTGGLISFEKLQIAYGETVPLPKPMINGKEFLGWYDEKGKVFGGTMPPDSITLYARWIDK